MTGTKDEEQPEATVMLPGGGGPGEPEGTVVLPGGGGPEEPEGTMVLPGGGPEEPEEEQATVMLSRGSSPEPEATMHLDGLGEPARSPAASGSAADSTVALTMLAPAPGGATEVVSAPRPAPLPSPVHDTRPRPGSSAHGTQLATRPPTAQRSGAALPSASQGSGMLVIVLTVIAVIAGVTVGLLI